MVSVMNHFKKAIKEQNSWNMFEKEDLLQFLDMQAASWQQLYKSFDPRVREEKERILRESMASFDIKLELAKAREEENRRKAAEKEAERVKAEQEKENKRKEGAMQTESKQAIIENSTQSDAVASSKVVEDATPKGEHEEVAKSVSTSESVASDSDTLMEGKKT